MTALPVLVSLLGSRVDPSAHEWLRTGLEAIGTPFDARAFRTAWSRVGRRLGSEPVVPTAEEGAELQRVGMWPFVGWGADECARAALLLRATDVADVDTHGALVESLYLRGTIRERQALLRSLAFLPDPGRFASVAVQACRSHVVAVFEALAVANPYPARHLPAPYFDQMVLKAIALRMGPERIVGLSERMSPELARARAPQQRTGADAPGLVLVPT